MTLSDAFSQPWLVGLLALFFGVLVYFHFRKGNTYSVVDILLDAKTGKASLDAHVVLFFAGLSAWYIVLRTLEHEDVGRELIEILGIMILYRGAKQAIQAYRDRPADFAGRDGDTIVERQVVLPASPPPVRRK